MTNVYTPTLCAPSTPYDLQAYIYRQRKPLHRDLWEKRFQSCRYGRELRSPQSGQRDFPTEKKDIAVDVIGVDIT